MTEARDGAAPTEVAGETTAADMVSVPADTRPVGTDTLIDIAEAPEGDKKRETK
ncbi:MAG: hypothetical protein QOJ76_1420 [Acidobacteriota bacterium]|jgi:hypothetical protein|nr:hypothetical protein [Acidobacteriota bacterium]